MNGGHRPLWRRIPVAWLQLSHQKIRFATAILGAAFATVLMFVQLGLKESLLDSVTVVEKTLAGDLYLVDLRSKALTVSQPFSRRLLLLAKSYPEVAEVAELRVTTGQLKNPLTGSRRQIFVIGVDPENPALRLPAIATYREAMRASNQLLFDRRSSELFGPLAKIFNNGQRPVLRLEQASLRLSGLFDLGAGFASDGNVLLGNEAFQRAFPDRSNGGIDLGVLHLRAGASCDQVRASLSWFLPKSLRVMTREELMAWEQEYWGSSTAIGAIFNQGVVIGFVVGVVVVYLILYTDVTNHLSEYATLKAIGYSDGYLVSIVFQEAVILSVLGYVPGIGISSLLYRLTESATAIPMGHTWQRSLLVFSMTLSMCFLSGALAMRKLRQAAPAEVF